MNTCEVLERWNSNLVPIKEAIPELTQFQLDSLIETASGDSGLFMMARPTAADPMSVVERYTQSNVEVDQLIEMGFVIDVTENFKEQVEQHKKTFGRMFRLLSISALGKAMFNVSTNPCSSCH